MKPGSAWPSHSWTWDSKGVRLWRDAGRVEWAAMGAWPWALTESGKLSRVWWSDPMYADALREWATGEP